MLPIASGWSAPVEFLDILELEGPIREAEAPFVPRFRFVLDDLAVETDARLRQRAGEAITPLVLLTLRHGRGDFRPRLLGLVDLMQQVLEAPYGFDALSRVLRYILEVADGVTQETLKQDLVPLLGPNAEEVVMTGGQILIEQGRQEGLQKGLQEGQRLMLSRLLEIKFGPLPPEIGVHLEAAGPELLTTWMENALSATGLPQVFAAGGSKLPKP